MNAPKRHDLRVWYVANPPRRAVHVYVRNMAEALAVLATIEAVTGYETVHGLRQEVETESGVQRFEPYVDSGYYWVDVDDWELDAVQEILDAA